MRKDILIQENSKGLDLNLNLLNTMANYKIKVDKGLGSININGQEVADESTTGSGLTDIDVDGGVGSINISTK